MKTKAVVMECDFSAMTFRRAESQSSDPEIKPIRVIEKVELFAVSIVDDDLYPVIHQEAS